MRPTPMGIRLVAAGFVVALLPALVAPTTWPMLPLLWGLLTLAYGVDAVLSPSRSRVTWQLQTPELLYIGERDEASLEVRFPTRRAVHGEVALDLSADLEPQPAGQLGARDGAARVRFRLDPRRRGTVVIEQAWIRYRSPLGLWFWTIEAPLQRSLPVLPNLLLVRRTAVRFFSDRDFRAGLKIERYKGDGTEFESLKEFRRGDDPRAMDWKASARHRRLLCRQYRAERNHQILLTVDTGHLMSESLGGVPKLDHALNAALVLAYICLSSGDRVGLFTFDSKIGPGLDPVGGVASMTALTQLSSRIDYSRDETNFTLGLTTLSQRIRRRSLVILLTDFVDTVTTELMMENLERVGRRHLVVFVSIRDPLLTRLTGQRPVTAEELHRAVVARTLLNDRELVHNRLKQLGVYPLDAEPSRIGPELINQYLDIKRRELV